MSQPSAASQGNSSVIHNTYASQRSTASTQQTAEEEINSRGGIVLVDYEKEKQLFEKFMREHTIVVTDPTTATTRNRGRNNNDDSDSDENDDDIMWEPLNEDEYGTGVRRRRIPAYAHHLQRICNREYYEPDKRVFILEVPLQEVANFGQADLAQRAANNTLRYEEVFSQVVDSLLANLTRDNNANNNNNQQNPYAPPDSVELLHQHRLQQQERQQQARQEAQAAAAHNHYAGNDNQNENGNDDNNNNNNSQQATRNPVTNATEAFPAILLRRYELRILPLGRNGVHPPFHVQYHGNDKSVSPPAAVSLRQVRSPNMGRLVTLSGMIVRASDVKPCTLVATYSCDACGAEIYQPVPYQREFVPPRACPSAVCQQRGKNAFSLQLQTRGSKFTKFQEIKLQELPSQVPMGHVPRSLTVHCRGELTRLCAPGDVVTIDGIYLPQRLAESGYKALKAGLVSLTYLHAQHICVHKKSYDDNDDGDGDDPDGNNTLLSTAERVQLHSEVEKVAHGPDPVGRLSSSLAPEIFGHEDIKRALLLQLVGGVTRQLPDGMKIRGDLNLCLMGDPGVAKSQLLKHVASIAPRGVYTTGKGSSGVGLTAAVTKDLVTGEMALEGGALVLADRGICCIDEFDKMDEADRTAIHEVMEQQQVSIAKAGIVATLNARTGVLAAANPLYSRYNRNKSLSENVALPNSLLSRFDLLFLILDIPNMERDLALARHVTLVHQNEGLDKTAGKKRKNRSGDNDDEDSDEDEDEMEQQEDNDQDDDETGPVSPRVLREYICRARRHKPVVPPEVSPYIVEAYVSLRLQQQRGSKKSNNDQTVMTPRQLLSILRLSQALARLRFSDVVARQDVDEAIRLTHMSKASLEDVENNGNNGSSNHNTTGGFRQDVTSRIFQVLRDYLAATGAASDEQEIELSTAQAMVLRKGFTNQQFQTCLEEYEALKVIQVNQTRTHIYFL